MLLVKQAGDWISSLGFLGILALCGVTACQGDKSSSMDIVGQIHAQRSILQKNAIQFVNLAAGLRMDTATQYQIAATLRADNALLCTRSFTGPRPTGICEDIEEGIGLAKTEAKFITNVANVIDSMNDHDNPGELERRWLVLHDLGSLMNQQLTDISAEYSQTINIRR